MECTSPRLISNILWVTCSGQYPGTLFLTLWSENERITPLRSTSHETKDRTIFDTNIHVQFSTIKDRSNFKSASAVVINRTIIIMNERNGHKPDSFAVGCNSLFTAINTTVSTQRITQTHTELFLQAVTCPLRQGHGVRIARDDQLAYRWVFQRQRVIHSIFRYCFFQHSDTFAHKKNTRLSFTNPSKTLNPWYSFSFYVKPKTGTITQCYEKSHPFVQRRSFSATILCIKHIHLFPIWRSR